MAEHQRKSGDGVTGEAEEASKLPELPHGNMKIDVADLTVGENIGAGGFGSVFRGSWKGWNGEVAMKRIECNGDAEKEVGILSDLKHPNVIRLYGTAMKDPQLYIVMELAKRGTVSGHIQKNRGKPNMKLSLHWAIDIAEGMRYIHEKGFAHRNLKSRAVLLTTTLTAKIGSFGRSRHFDHTTKATMAGTFQWMAPEVIMEAAYSQRCDLFSFGMLLWELSTHEVPFEELRGSPFKIQKAIVDGERPTIPDGVKTYLAELILQCWNNKPKDRPSFAEILAVLKPHLQANVMAASLEHDTRKIAYGDIQFGETIGRGTFGTVFRGRLDKCMDVAIKKVSSDVNMDKEVTTMSDLKYHPNIITLYGTACTDDHLYIVMELAECSLYGHIEDHRGKPDMERSLRWAAQVAEGMRYLHENDIVHRDLKSLNVLLTTVSRLRVAKICDFGTARKLDHETFATYTGTVKWMAPEVIQCKEYSKRCDLFSYGTVLWELVTHEVPFEGKTPLDILNAIVEGKMLPVPATVEAYLFSLIQHCWEPDPEERLCFVEILLVLDKKEMIQEHAIKLDSLEFGDKIGEGAFCEVFKGHWKLKDKTVAIKQIPYDEGIVKEVNIMSELKHPNIITFYGTVSKDPYLCIVLELAESSLYKHIEDNSGKPNMKMSLRWAVEVAKGMKCLHEKEIVHRDLKSNNVLLTSRKKVAKICDFGISRLMDHSTEATMAGTFAWMAPEVILEQPYSKNCDLFSYGMVLWELVTHEVPFKELKGTYQIMIAITKGKMPHIPAAVESYLSELIQQCWSNSPEERPSFADILSALRKDEHAKSCDGEDEIKASSEPLVEHLELLPCGNAPIKVATEIQDNWQKVAKRLDMPANIREEIEQQSSSPEQKAMSMLKRWLEGGYECEEPVTWDTLIAALMCSGYTTLSKKLARRTVD